MRIRVINKIAKHLFRVKTGYHNGAWWAAHAGENNYGICIYNPDTENGEFPTLIDLLKWCVKHQRDRP